MNIRDASCFSHGIISFIFLASSLLLNGQVEPANDGPKPRSPSESMESFELPPGFRMELVASEPLIEEPSGVCWDADGHFYVSELHGYNLEGQFDIEALNKTGKLDRIVRRIQANDEAKQAAEAETFGVIKQLSDDDGDGQMDRVSIFAQGLPPCFGMVAAREGIIVICAPDIYYLADLDSDGVADVRERLFTGFQAGVLERRINAPQWGLDNWIYVGGGGRADAITGPHIDGPVALGRTDFRFRADGSAIEPVAGSTGTFGHTFTAEGDRLTISTGTPGIQVIPLPWRYLGRNPDLSIPSLERNAANYQSTFPVAPPHPWRARRASDPGFSKYYTDHYGAAESTPSGFFTSACSPFIYRDVAFPAEYRGHNFSCEPAQNLIHHSVPRWQGPVLRLLKGGEKPAPKDVRDWASAIRTLKVFDLPVPGTWKELGPLRGGGDKTFLFEKDFGPESHLDLGAVIDGKSWKDKMTYQDGEVIDLGLPENAAVYLHRTLTSKEDASIYVSLGSNDAIKCWLNGVQVLENNVNRGAAADQESVMLNLKQGKNSFLMKIVNGTNASGFYFKMRSSHVPEKIHEIARISADKWEEGQWESITQYYQTHHSNQSRKEFLASSDMWFHPMNLTHGPDGSIYITDFYREIIEDYSAIPRYLQQQYGLVNGRHHGRIWRLTHEDAVTAPDMKMSHLHNAQLAEEIGSPHAWRRETARRLLIERKAQDVTDTVIELLRKRDGSPATAINALYALEGLGALTGECFELAFLHEDWSVVRHALMIGDQLSNDTESSRVVSDWLSEIIHYRNEPRLLLQIALSLGEFQTSGALDALAYLANQHGDIRWMDTALMSSVHRREEGLLSRVLLSGGSDSTLAEILVATLASRGDEFQIQKAKTAVKFLAKDPQKALLQKILDAGLSDSKERLERIVLEAPEAPDSARLKIIEKQLPSYLDALVKVTDVDRGRDLFGEHCASCHQARGLGQKAGPNLDSEWQRAPEMIVRDILFPNEKITQGFESVRLEMRQGSDVMGLMASESPTSVTLRFPGGQDFTFLKKHIRRTHTYAVSMMPAQFSDVLNPEEVASIVSFLRSKAQ